MAPLPPSSGNIRGSVSNSMPFKYESSNLSGSVFVISSDGRVLSLPIPTRSSRDPLNWSKLKRARAFVTIFFFAVLGLAIVKGPSLMAVPLEKTFSTADTKPFSLSVLQSALTLFIGIGPFLWIPLSLAIGRRPVFLLCNIILLLSTLLAGTASSFYQLLIAVCLQGVAVGANSSILLLMVIDLTFTHERPKSLATLWCIGGFITDCIFSIVAQKAKSSDDWRTFYLLWFIPTVVSFLLAFFFYPETYFIRPAVAFDGRILVQSSTEKVRIYQDWEEVPGGKSLPDTPNQSIYLRDLRFWGTTKGGWKAMWSCYPQILGCFVNPLIFWVALLNAIVFGSVLSIGQTYALVLSGPPYFFDIHIVGLISVASGIGSLLAWPAAGLMIEFVSRRLAIRNGGVRDAEHYLPAFILPIVFGTASMILYGLATGNHWHFMLIYFSCCLNGFTLVSLATANTLWVTDAFPQWAAPALVVLGGLSYIASFGISFAIQPWIAAQGIAIVNIEIGIMIALVGFVLIPITFWGKRLRQHIHARWGTGEMGALRPQ